MKTELQIPVAPVSAPANVEPDLRDLQIDQVVASRGTNYRALRSFRVRK